jgi:hypothetical protein
MMSDAVAAFLERYRELGLDGSPNAPGDVAQLEKEAGVPLPAAYKAYLLIAGQQPSTAWVGSDCTIQHLPKLSGWAEHLLSVNHQPALPKQAFVFIMHQGYQFKYFIADGRSDDPPVSYLPGGRAQNGTSI